MQTQAEADITQGASVLIVDPIDSGSGAAIEANAVSKGVKVIDYDRLTLGGPATLLRQLRQRRGRQDDRQGLRRLRHGVERRQAATCS